MANGKGRNWEAIVYPESAKPGWMDFVKECGVKAYISPLHDKDKDEHGKIKKAHYHVLFMFDGAKTFESFFALATKNLGAARVEEKFSPKGSAAYLCHMYNPDKYRYDEHDVVTCGGARPYIEYCSEDMDPLPILMEMMEFIEKNRVHSYYKFSLYCMRNKEIWFGVLSSSKGVFIKDFLRSKNYEKKEGIMNLDKPEEWK